MKLTIFFDGQFWVGVIEESQGSRLKAYKHLFGPEPSDSEVLDFVNRRMIKFIENTTEYVDIKHSADHRINPKRLARQAAKELMKSGVSTKAQEAIRLELEKRKTESLKRCRQLKEEVKNRKRQIAVLKAKAKHRGR